MWLFCRLLLLIVGILAINFHLAVHQGEFAEPVSVTLEGFGERDVASARLFAVYVGDPIAAIPASGPGHWECVPRCLLTIALQFPETTPNSEGVVLVRIGDQSFTRPLREFRLEGQGYLLPDDVVLRDPPGFAMCRNWPGMRVFLEHFARRTAPGLATVLVLALGVWVGLSGGFRDRFREIVGLTHSAAPSPPAPLPEGEGRAWNLAGWLGLIGGFIGLQVLEPYYFTQDDALVGELPGILLGCRSLWQGTFPDWNPYVFLGAPLATIGFWAITYPPQLLSYGIARHLLGNEFATMEVFAALHMFVGFVAMRHLSRRVGMGAMTANVAALSFVFAGCILIMGRSWHAFVCNAVWLPLLGIAIQRFREGPVGWKWIVGVGLVLGLSYHAGFPQIVAILGMFLVVGVVSVAVADRISWRRVAPVVPAVLLGIGLAAPLLLHHLQMTGGHARFVPAERGVYDSLHASLLPYPLAQADLPTHWGSADREKMGHFYFFGGVFAALFALQAIAFWVCFPERQAWARAWWVPSGIFALFMVLGEPAGLWQGLSALPMSKFFLRYSFRFYPCLAFCAILSGGLILERIVAVLRIRSTWKMLIGGAMLGILAWHVFMCRPSFYSYGFRPYPALPADFEATFHPSDDKASVGATNSRRLASWHPLRSTSSDFYAALPLNLPHYYQVPTIFGYDPVVEGQPSVMEVYRRLQAEPIAACKAYGVGWHLFAVHRSGATNAGSLWSMERTIPFEPAHRVLVKAEMTTLAEYGGTSLKELAGVDPLAFATHKPARPLPMRLHCRGADVDVSGLAAGSQVTVNFLWHPHMTLTLDGHTLPFEKDDWQRITTTLPASGSSLNLRFEPPWHKTCAVGAGLCVAALLLAWGALRFREPHVLDHVNDHA